MKCKKRVLSALLGLACVALPVSPASLAEIEEARTKAEIRISLPDGTDTGVSVSPADNRVLLELPRGSVFPLDFAASSGGLLRGGEVVPLDDNRVRLELELAQGLLDRVEFDSGAIVLRFSSRFDAGSAERDTTDEYLLGPDDKIIITVHNHPELTSHLTVTRGGMITAPLVGDVMASGMSPRKLASRLAERLGRDYLVNPQIDVEIEEYRSQWVMVSGEIRLPGRVSLTGGTRLKEALSVAGGFTSNAGERIMISRESGKGEERIYVDRMRFERGERNPMLFPGDIIDVNSTAYCYVHGEVNSPTRIRVERGMTLLKALTIAGGLTQWANQKSVLVLPGGTEIAANGMPAGDDPAPGGRAYNVKRIQAGRDEDPLLRGGEIVVVKRRFF